MYAPLSTFNNCSLFYRYAVVCEGRVPHHTRLHDIAEALVDLEACHNLDVVAHYLRETLPTRWWFIYKGGSHVAVHLRGLFGNVRHQRFLTIRNTELEETQALPAAFRSDRHSLLPVRLLPAFHAPEGCVLYRDLTIQVERGAQDAQRKSAVKDIADLLVRLRRSPNGANTQEQQDVLGAELQNSPYHPLPEDLKHQLTSIVRVLADNSALFYVGRAYGVTFGCSLLVKQFLRSECGELGDAIACNMLPMKEREARRSTKSRHWWSRDDSRSDE